MVVGCGDSSIGDGSGSDDGSVSVDGGNDGVDDNS